MDYIKELLSLLRIFISIASTSFVALVAWVFIHFDTLSIGELIACGLAGVACVGSVSALLWIYLKQLQLLQKEQKC